MSSVEQYWYRKPKAVPFHLKLLSYVFRVVAALRRFSYRILFFRVYRAPVPVIIVGNISVGGSGKTPLVAWLVKELKKAGYHPGIVSRGYGGNASTWPQQVRPDSDTSIVGDEAVLLARRCQCPMAVSPNRVEAVKALLETRKVDVIVSDDGMQHYALGRDIEIAVIDGERRFGNRYCLPAGPLREPVRRLDKVDFRVTNGGRAEPTEYAMQLKMGKVINLVDPKQQKPIESFHGKKVHAIAGIGNPGRFFTQLSGLGVELEEHAFADHHPFVEQDIRFEDQIDVLMTEKDAVKCERFAGPHHWYVSVDAELDAKLSEEILALVAKKAASRKHRWTVNYSTS